MLVAPFDRMQAQQARLQWTDYLRRAEQTTNSIGMKLVLIPPGEFMMGSTPEQIRPFLRDMTTERNKTFGNDQYPQHRVRITRPFNLGIYEVTRGQFAQFVRATSYKTDAERDGRGSMGLNPQTGKIGYVKEFNWRNPGFTQDDTHPVVSVSWNDAVAFCNWLSEKEGEFYRLPTEAEWEYACRAGTTTVFFNGDDPSKLVTVGNINDAAFTALSPGKAQATIKDGYAVTAPVGSFPPNAFDLHDMHGNVWEWCQDRYDQSYYTHSPEADPTGPREGKAVVRGGAFDCPPRYCLSANRSSADVSERVANTGFRVVLVPRVRSDSQVAAQGPASAPGFVPLFNGKDLTGWKTHPSQPGNWRVENGILIGSTSERSHLYTERGDFKDFHLRVEARINDGGNSGVYFRSTFGPADPRDRPTYPIGYEAQIDSTVNQARTGSLYAANQIVVGVASTLVPPGQWFTEEIIAERNRFTVKVNGKTTAVYRDKKRISANGHIALQQLNASTVAEFRKIEIKEFVTPARSAPAVETDSAVLIAPFDEATAKNAQQAWAVRLKTTIERTNSIGMKLILIPPGTFAMGSPKEEQGRGKNEDLVRVTLTKAFWLGQHEVTQTEWRRVMHTTPWVGMMNSKQGNDYPATYVNWADAVEFCTKLTEIDRQPGLLGPGSEYVLPTEAQWEYACRAGTTTRYAFGDDEEDLPRHGWFKRNAIDVRQKYPHRVGRKKANAWGLFDMHGNVWEWCRDAYQEGLPGGTDPEVSSESSVRVNRSGCWGNPGGSCRSASRYGRPMSESRRDSLGFRIACTSNE